MIRQILKIDCEILTINLFLIMEDLNVKPDVKNIEQYVAKVIITELNKQNKELEKLRYIVNQVYYCDTCHFVDQIGSFSNFARCENCGKITCGSSDCFQTWIDDRSSLGQIIYFCSSDCHSTIFITKN